MLPGIRATVEFRTPEGCPLAKHSALAETTIHSVAVSARPSDDTELVTEFSMDAEYDPEGDITPIFSHGTTRRYRFVHEDGVSCPCECLGQHGCPITRYDIREGTLILVFYADGYDQLQDVIADLRERFPDVDIKRFIRSPAGERTRDLVFVDRGKLTARQRQILRKSYEMGYFERPRQANATEIAEALDINPSTFSEHLAAAESKILDDLF
ncbi:XRE family transcriptional regulator [Haladaptatus sp. R4]|uniref:helix-turn-helix domain-containing protein n=1 Tax=Haladaptatus sp. R4 TaxID=1679489 RepID=UPI0007B4AD1B|nr:XRE family transcriptional regulator [Haladaptatus sp. R4]